jgi:hypothetical protein
MDQDVDHWPRARCGGERAMRNASDSTPDLFGWSPPAASEVAPRYPYSPGYRGARGEPSEVAAKAIALKMTGLRREVLNHLRTRAIEPLTADQIAIALARTPFSIRPRVTELYRMYLIERGAERGRNKSDQSAHRWRFRLADERAAALRKVAVAQ